MNQWSRLKLSERLLKNKKTDSPDGSSSINICYAEAVQLSPIVLRQISSQNHSKDQFIKKMSQDLDETKVDSAKIIESGKILVNAPNKENKSKWKMR